VRKTQEMRVLTMFVDFCNSLKTQIAMESKEIRERNEIESLS